MTDDWPKPWGDIYPHDTDGMTVNLNTTYLTIGDGLRTFDETVYINADAGHDTDENRDLWMPIGVYLAGGFEESVQR